MTSSSFIPDDYEAITLGSELSLGTLGKTNLIITPNGDLQNDTLVFEGLDEFIGNKLTIYNRWGNIVYQTVDYKNDWGGESSGKVIINKDKLLPSGTYFYTLNIDIVEGSSKTRVGWIYIQK